MQTDKAHQENDRAVMAAYGVPAKTTESECVAELFKRCQALVTAFMCHPRRLTDCRGATARMGRWRRNNRFAGLNEKVDLASPSGAFPSSMPGGGGQNLLLFQMKQREEFADDQVEGNSSDNPGVGQDVLVDPRRKNAPVNRPE